MHLPFEVTGHYRITILSNDNVKEDIEFSNLITDIGLKDWVEKGIGNQLELSIGNSTIIPAKTLDSLPTGITNKGLVNVKNDGIVEETDTHLIYRYIYERICPKETVNTTYNTLTTVLPTTNNLFSIAKIKNMDNEDINISVKKDEQVLITYELRLSVAKDLYSRPNTDIGFAGLTDVSIRVEAGSNIKTGMSSVVTTLRNNEQVEDANGAEVSLARANTKLTVMTDRIRLSIAEKIGYTQFESQLRDIREISRDLGLFIVVTQLSPGIDRTLTTMDLTLELSLDIVKGG